MLVDNESSNSTYFLLISAYCLFIKYAVVLPAGAVYFPVSGKKVNTTFYEVKLRTATGGRKQRINKGNSLFFHASLL